MFARVGGSGYAEYALTVPQDQNSRQMQFHFQDAVVPPLPAQPWLSTSVAPIIF